MSTPVKSGQWEIRITGGGGQPHPTLSVAHTPASVSGHGAPSTSSISSAKMDLTACVSCSKLLCNLLSGIALCVSTLFAWVKNCCCCLFVRSDEAQIRAFLDRFDEEDEDDIDQLEFMKAVHSLPENIRAELLHRLSQSHQNEIDQIKRRDQASDRKLTAPKSEQEEWQDAVYAFISVHQKLTLSTLREIAKIVPAQDQSPLSVAEEDPAEESDSDLPEVEPIDPNDVTYASFVKRYNALPPVDRQVVFNLIEGEYRIEIYQILQDQISQVLNRDEELEPNEIKRWQNAIFTFILQNPELAWKMLRRNDALFKTLD